MSSSPRGRRSRRRARNTLRCWGSGWARLRWRSAGSISMARGDGKRVSGRSTAVLMTKIFVHPHQVQQFEGNHTDTGTVVVCVVVPVHSARDCFSQTLESSFCRFGGACTAVSTRTGMRIRGWSKDTRNFRHRCFFYRELGIFVLDIPPRKRRGFGGGARQRLFVHTDTPVKAIGSHVAQMTKRSAMTIRASINCVRSNC
jgi:hypothetical protein